MEGGAEVGCRAQLAAGGGRNGSLEHVHGDVEGDGAGDEEGQADPREGQGDASPERVGVVLLLLQELV